MICINVGVSNVQINPYIEANMASMGVNVGLSLSRQSIGMPSADGRLSMGISSFAFQGENGLPNLFHTVQRMFVVKVHNCLCNSSRLQTAVLEVA